LRVALALVLFCVRFILAGARRSNAVVRRAFENACTLYDELATALTAIIMRLKAQGEAAGALSGEEADVVKAHQKTVLMVLDFEAQILKRRIGAVTAANAGKRLDLDAARAEVAGRLDRLAAAEGT